MGGDVSPEVLNIGTVATNCNANISRASIAISSSERTDGNARPVTGVEASSADDRVVLAGLAVGGLDARRGDGVDTRADELDIVLDEGLEVAGAGGETTAGDGEGGNEGIGNLGLLGELLDH